MRANIPKSAGPQNMQAMLKQAQKMQEDMENLQAELDEREYDVSAGGGVVTVKISGKKEILAIDIKPEIVDCIKNAAARLDVEVVELCGLDKLKGHPTELGMSQLFDQVMTQLSLK